MQDIDWDCFRYITAIVDHGSASSAAISLGVDASTVQRKISRFERDHGVRLFDRRRSGYTPTLECSAIIEAARSMEDHVNAIRRTVLGQDLRLEGAVSITTTDSLFHSVLVPHLVEYRATNPQITLEMTVTNNRLNLARLDADIAVRPSRNPPQNLMAERIATLNTAVYAAKSFDKSLDDAAMREGRFWIGMGESLAGSPAQGWMEKNILKGALALTADTFPAIARLCEQGAGLAPLPCCLGDASPLLERRTKILPQCATDIWVLTHPDTRQSARIRSVRDFLIERLRADLPKLEGTI